MNDNQFLQTIATMKPPKNAINILKNIHNIPFFVYTISKTGTTTLAISLQKMMNNCDTYEHVVHCHSESCWKRIFNIDFNFDLMDLIKSQSTKPVIFQLSRDPVQRLVSLFYHVNRHVTHCASYDKLIHFLENNKNGCNYAYYEKKFNVKLKDLTFCHQRKCCVVDKDDYILFYMKLEDFDAHLETNIKRELPHLKNVDTFKLCKSNVTEKCLFTKTMRDIENKGLPPHLCQSIFNANRDEVHFFFSHDELSDFEAKYSVEIHL